MGNIFLDINLANGSTTKKILAARYQLCQAGKAFFLRCDARKALFISGKNPIFFGAQLGVRGSFLGFPPFPFSISQRNPEI